MSDVTCRGSFALGTACGRCSKCKAQIEEYEVRKTVRERLDGTAAFKSQIAALEARLAKAEMDSRSYQAMATDAIHRMDNAQAEVARLTAQLATARRNAVEGALNAVSAYMMTQYGIRALSNDVDRARVITLIAQEESKL